MNGVKRKHDGDYVSSFLAGSANAQRLRNTKNKEENINYKRNINASFHSIQNNGTEETASHKETASSNSFSLEDDQRQKAQRISDSLPLGPKDVQASEDDLHFTKIEPNTGIELKKRFLPNLNVSGYLEGRTLVPISTLYSICLPGESNDGKCTIPIDGDWLIIGAIAERKASFGIKGYKLDTKGKKIDEDKFKAAYLAYLERKAGEEPDLNDIDNPWRDVQKEVRSTISQTYTLVDIGQRLEKRETAGDSMLTVTVYKADEVRVDENANRRYIGGSGGAYELMDTLGAGTVVCLLNPIITQGPAMKANLTAAYNQSDTDKKKSKSGSNNNMIGLKPRRRENILTIGIAKHVGQCESIRRDRLKCNNFIDLRTPMRACSYHSDLSTSKSRRGRQEFANNTSLFMRSKALHATPYSFSDGMTFSQSKTYVSKGGPGKSADSRFDVDANMGRDIEAKLMKNARDKEAESKISTQLLMNRLTRPRDKDLNIKNADSQELKPSSSQNMQQSTSNSQKPDSQRYSYGFKLVQDARKELKKSSAVLPNSGEKKQIGNNRHHLNLSEKKDASGVKLDKLLARHSASSQIPMPLMNLKVGIGKSAVRAPSNPSFGRNLKLAPKQASTKDNQLQPIEFNINTEDDSLSDDDDLVIERVVDQRQTL